jgi:hypothetical protein
MVEPLRRALLDSQGIRKKTCAQPEWQDENKVENGQQHSGLEIADFMGNSLPGLPHAFEHIIAFS